MKNNNFKSIQFNNFAVEECERINIDGLIEKVKNSLKESLLKLEIEGLGKDIKLTSSKTGNGGKRYWFLCPKCGRRMGTLYKPPGTNLPLCRRCHKLSYLLAKHHRSPQEEHIKFIKSLTKSRGRTSKAGF